MNIKYSPQRSNEVIKYVFGDDVITATMNGITDTFDFSNFPEGKLELYDENGNPTIETNLPIQPIVFAERKNGELFVGLIKYHGEDASEKERFPDWQVV